jgi:Stage II sporulation protein E (SpoIIE)
MRPRAGLLAAALITLAFGPLGTARAAAQIPGLGVTPDDDEVVVNVQPIPQAPAVEVRVPVPREVQPVIPPAAREVLGSAPQSPPATGASVQTEEPGPGRLGLVPPTRRGGSAPVHRRARTSPVSPAAAASDAARDARAERPASGSEPRVPRPAGPGENGSGGAGPLPRIVADVVDVLPVWVRALLLALASVVALLAAASLLTRLRARRLRHEGEQLLLDAGILERALFPSVPDRIGPVMLSVGVEPADSPPGGRGFYEIFPIEGNRVGVVVGEVSRRGGPPLPRATLMRYTLRAQLELGRSPREALREAEELRGDDDGDGFATATVAVYDGTTGTLTYACAGHPAPIVAGLADDELTPVPQESGALGPGSATGDRETTISLPPDAVACIYTDGAGAPYTEPTKIDWARLAALAETDDADAAQLLARIRAESDWIADDVVVCLLRVAVAPCRTPVHVEDLGVRPEERMAADGFLIACGIAPRDAAALAETAVDCARDGDATLRVTWGPEGPQPALLAELERVESYNLA